MQFGPVPVAQAVGAILVHSREAGGRRLRKGTVLDADDVARLARAGVDTVVVARLEPGEVGEDEAARRLAAAAFGPGARPGVAGTGRVNLYAEAAGLAIVDAATVDAVNAIDEGITLATLPRWERVNARQIVATVKIIPFAVPAVKLDAAVALAGRAGALVQVAPFRPMRIALVQTTLPGVQKRILDKTVATLTRRVESLGSTLARTAVVAHDEAAVAGAVRDAIANGAGVVLIVGASATVDRRDVIPAGIVTAGGTVVHFGMPVDPGNLLVLARCGNVPVLALPGSARSPRTGGNDLVLERLLAGLPVTADDIMRLGVGGLLKENPARGLPRARAAPEDTPVTAGPRIAALVLAAGQSRRMGTANKLLLPVAGKAMVAHAADAALAAGADPVVVVTGHEAEQIRMALAGRPVAFTHNPDYAGGMSTSLRAGLAALPASVDAALVLLGDMPRVGADTIARLAAAFDPDAGRAICVPVRGGRRGNPVLWARRHFAEMGQLSGDAGARRLIDLHADAVIEVPMADDAVLVDVDTPQSLAELDGDRARPD
ncbi:MAG: NTP transferase domain-containing protein [Alphaproteobacteria bacterium]